MYLLAYIVVFCNKYVFLLAHCKHMKCYDNSHQWFGNITFTSIYLGICKLAVCFNKRKLFCFIMVLLNCLLLRGHKGLPYSISRSFKNQSFSTFRGHKIESKQKKFSKTLRKKFKKYYQDQKENSI